MNDTKHNAARDHDEMIAELQWLADIPVGECPQQLCHVARDLIAAYRYNDETLVDSHRTALFAIFAEMANDWIAKELEASKATQEGLRKVWQKRIENKAYELAVFDRLKDTIESIVDKRVSWMRKLSETVQDLEKFDQEVEKSPALAEGVRKLQAFRLEFFSGWPAERPPSPIDREAIDRAREAIRGGAKGLTKDRLVWGHNPVEKAG